MAVKFHGSGEDRVNFLALSASKLTHFHVWCPQILPKCSCERSSRQNRSVKSRQRKVMDLDVTDLGVSGPMIPFCATDALRGRVTPVFNHFSKHLSSVLGRTELCHEVRNPGPQKPQIIRNENHHSALFGNLGTSEIVA